MRAEQPRSSRVVRFGVFEADLSAGELRKNGLKIKLQDHPFRLLAFLLERPGEVVTREELRQRLWSADTFVEFDHSVNTAIRKIREALDDSSNNPRFVETLPRRGYRFIAPVDGDQPVAAIALPPTKRLWLRAGSVVAVAIVAATTGWLALRKDTPDTAPFKVAPLTTYPGVEAHPSFSPDGSEVAFAWGRDYSSNYDIYVKQIGVDQPSQLTDHPAHEFGPAWSPKGTHIAFLRFLPPSKIQVLLIPQRGGPEEVLTEFFGRASAAGVLGAPLTWTPDAEWLVTEGRNDERQPRSLFLVSTSTGEKRQLTWPEKTQRDTSPAVSPDGRSLVFARKDAVHRSDLYLLHLSRDMTPSGSPIKLPPADLENHHPAWTADGREIVFAAGKIWNDSLWRMQPSPSGSPRWLGITGGSNRQPAIARAGNRLAFTKLRGNQNIWQLNLASGDGGTLTPVPFVRSTHNDAAPDYSPNGERIAFGSNRSGSPEIWLCNADGSQPVPLTSFRGPKVVSPRWSPNGEQIAFSSEADGNLEMYTISVKGRTRKRLTTHPAWDGNAHWSRDGKWIYFVSDRSGTLGAWKMPAEGGDALPLSGPLSNVRYDGTPIESPDGKYLYFLRDDSAWRIPVEGGEAVRIVEELFSRGRLAVFEDGLYYIGKADEDGTHPIRFKDFASGGEKTLATTAGEVFWYLAVSPDRRTLLYVQEVDGGGDLMLVENFQ